MIKSLREIINYSKKIELPVCIETQGSIVQKNRLLLQHRQSTKEFQNYSEIKILELI